MKALELLVLMVLAYSCHAIPQAEAHQQLCSAKFEKLSETGKQGRDRVCDPEPLWLVMSWVCFLVP